MNSIFGFLSSVVSFPIRQFTRITANRADIPAQSGSQERLPSNLESAASSVKKNIESKVNEDIEDSGFDSITQGPRYEGMMSVYFSYEKDNPFPVIKSKQYTPFTPSNFFTHDEEIFLKKVFSNWHFHVNLSLLEILGCHLYQLLNSLEEKEDTVKQAKSILFSAFASDYVSCAMVSNFSTKKFSLLEHGISEVKSTLDKITNRAELKDKIKEAQKILDVILRAINSNQSEAILYINNIDRYRCCAMMTSDSSYKDTLNDLITYLKFFNYSFKCAQLDDQDLFEKIISELGKLLAFLEKDFSKTDLKEKFSSFRSLIDKSTKKQYNKISKQIKSVKKKGMIKNELEFESLITTGDKFRNANAWSTILINVSLIVEVKVIKRFFPKFLIKTECLSRLNQNIRMGLEHARKTSDSKLEVERDDKRLNYSDPQLLEILTEIQSDNRQLVLTEMGRCPFRKIIDSLMHYLIDLCVIIPPPAVLDIFLKSFEGFAHKYYINTLVRDIKQMHKKHLEKAKVFIKKINDTKPELTQDTIAAIQDHCFKQSLLLCRYIMILKDAEKLSNFDDNVNELFESENFLLPRELTSYMNLGGIQDILTPKSKPKIQPILTREDVWDYASSSDSEEEVSERVKIKTKGTGRLIKEGSSKSDEKSEESKESNEEANAEPLFKRGDDHKVVKKKLKALGYLPLKKRGKGSHALFKKPGGGPAIPVPSSSRDSLKLGTLHSISESAQRTSK